MVPNRSLVSSLRNKKRPHPSRSKAKLSTLTPEKSSKHTLKMCRITCVGTTLNFVKFDKNATFCRGLKKVILTKLCNLSYLLPYFRKLFDYVFLPLQITKLILKLAVDGRIMFRVSNDVTIVLLNLRTRPGPSQCLAYTCLESQLALSNVATSRFCFSEPVLRTSSRCQLWCLGYQMIVQRTSSPSQDVSVLPSNSRKQTQPQPSQSVSDSCNQASEQVVSSKVVRVPEERESAYAVV